MRADKASTSLMAVMKNNELLTSAVLSVRKAGGTPIPYFVMTLSQARIIGFELQSDLSPEGAPVLTEHLSLTYKSISIEYSVQGDKGIALSTSNFMADAAPE
jgi:type VI secretion system secreted protein Hcp